MNRHPGRVGQELAHVLWMGGSPCAGKSSIADILAARHGLRLYRCDDAYDRHLSQADPDRQPMVARARTMTWDEIWGRPVATQVREEFQFYREEFEMIVDDLLALPEDRPILAEGTALLPDCVAHLHPAPRRAIWVVPTEVFQREYYPLRGEWVDEVLHQCRDPAAAFGRWMARDVRFARLVARRAAERGLQVIRVDGSVAIPRMAEIIKHHFQLGR